MDQQNKMKIPENTNTNIEISCMVYGTDKIDTLLEVINHLILGCGMIDNPYKTR